MTGPFTEAQLSLAALVLERCRSQRISIATAESCTGGLVAACLTAIPGASDVFDRGFVTYSNSAKTAELGVPEALLRRHGAVSEPVALAMAEGALTAGRVGLAVAVTGIAGPGGGSAERPVGLVHFATARLGYAVVPFHEIFSGDRDAIRSATMLRALELLAGRVA